MDLFYQESGRKSIRLEDAYEGEGEDETFLFDHDIVYGENAVKSLSIAASFIKRREDSVVPLVFSALIHPKYHEQKRFCSIMEPN